MSTFRAANASAPAAVIGSGPNGLAAAVTLARAGVPVTVFEAAETIGGGTRTETVVHSVPTGDGASHRPVVHDVCSAVHPLALASEFFTAFELTRRVNFTVPEASYAHPLDSAAGGSRAALAYRDLDRTVDELGRDGRAYARFYRPLLAHLDALVDVLLGPSIRRAPRSGEALATLAATAAFGRRAVEQGTAIWNTRFREGAAPALISGVAAHSIAPLPGLASAGVAALLGALGHTSGWPVPRGGSRAISDALAHDLLAHGGEIRTASPITDVRELGGYGVKLFDTSARGLARIAAAALPDGYRRRLERFRYGNAAAKVDFVLNGPIPWADPRVAQAPTVHVGGSRAEIAAAERAVARGQHPERPYVLLVQPSAFDPGRNPANIHAIGSYTHVPAGSTVDIGERVIAQIERFAPGFRDRITVMRVTSAVELEQQNANYIGGDFSAGAVTLRQLLGRPTGSADPHRTPAAGIYLASASAAPGPGVHGLAGWYAARSALRHEYRLATPELGLGGAAVA